MSQRPLIGVTGPHKTLNWARWAIAWQVRRAGGRPLYLPPGSDLEAVSLAAVIISGGNDLSPALYGEDEVRARVDPERDEHELRALELAEERELPVLGICRGAQLLNVEAGGNLHSDINHLRKITSRRPHLLPYKTVKVENDSRLAAITGTETFKVNSLHHQAVDEVGEGFRIVGRDLDGIVQAIEQISGCFRVGVQWHPEYLPWMRVQRRLFRALVAAARVS
ncbi:MAG: gamma-glutamyl-gamma-aminobutyrate hydrolase family protein [Xanthomonadales bacterium]|nr:gamma-glutamyl-gamma-aminobutyrate hydrolase family protein [Xanthomonadales bacterium]